jgi:hypothetical protein
LVVFYGCKITKYLNCFAQNDKKRQSYLFFISIKENKVLDEPLPEKGKLGGYQPEERLRNIV